MNVFKYTYQGVTENFILVSSLFPSINVSLLLLFLSITALSWYLIIYGKGNKKQESRLVFLSGSLYLASTYIITLVYSDEVFINLEHSYNLFHHGLFSFSPQKMVDGTVEFLYYLLLTPFSSSIKSLVIASYILGFVIALGHLYLFWKMFRNEDTRTQFVFMILFGSYATLVTILSDGFGNGLLSLLLVYIIYLQYTGAVKHSMYVTSLLPIIRPDAIIYSAAIFFSDYILNRKIRYLNYIGSLGFLFAYFYTFNYFYGHWIPTPIEFKAFSIDMIFSFGSFVRIILRATIRLVSDPIFILLFIGFLTTIFIRIEKRNLLVAKTILLSFFPIMVFYFLTSSHQVNYDGRYYVGFIVILLVYNFIYISDFHLLGRIWDYYGKASLICRKKGYALMLSTFLMAVFYYGAFQLTNLGGVRNQMERVNDLGVGGQIADNILPKDWSIGVTELNTFGFFLHDREVIDFWGYTNPAIAHSDSISQRGVRILPSLLTQILPDVLWYRTTMSGSGRAGDFNSQRILQQFILSPNVRPEYNQLGNAENILRNYDIFFLINDKWKSTVLVKKEKYSQFVDSIKSHGYREGMGNYLE